MPDRNTEIIELNDKDACSTNALKLPQVIDITAEDHDYCATNKDTSESNLDSKRCKTKHSQCRSTDNMLRSKDEICCSVAVPKNMDETEQMQDALEEQSSVCQEHTSIFKQHPGSVFPFNTSDYRFECICGELGLVDYKARVQCLNCHLWQHAECVNYKEENLKIKPFYCPHCLVAMKPVPTGATLIISPSSICHQWVDEINRHVRSSSLRVLVRSIPYKNIVQ